jgi:dienelactone hydrolase
MQYRHHEPSSEEPRLRELQGTRSIPSSVRPEVARTGQRRWLRCSTRTALGALLRVSLTVLLTRPATAAPAAVPTPAIPTAAAARPAPPYQAGSTTFCVVDNKRGFDEAGGVSGGRRLLVVEAWYPIDAAVAERQPLSKYGDYFAGDRELLERTQRALLRRSGVAEAAVESHLELARAQFDLLRGSHRNAPLARSSKPFPLVIYSHGTLQQRFSNDVLAEELARNGYVVLAPEHTGNDSLAPLGTFCAAELARNGVKPAALAQSANFDAARGEYAGQRLEPFFLTNASSPQEGSLSPAEVALTLDRVGDYRAVLDAARRRYRGRVLVRPRSVGLVGYSRGAMHGLVGAELLPEIGASALIVGGTPLAFYARDAQAAPINAALARASRGKRRVLDRLTKPLLEIIGGEDSRRKGTSDVAATIGVYPKPTAQDPSPLVTHGLAQLEDGVFGALVKIDRLEHADLVDDPFVVAYRAPEGEKRAGAFDPATAYVSRPLAERQAIRDHFVLALFNRFIAPRASRSRRAAAQREPLPNPFSEKGVLVEINVPTAPTAQNRNPE